MMAAKKWSVRRSGLTMPVVTSRFVDNAWRRGCDFVYLDLEGSVPRHLKDYARGLIKEAIPKVEQGGTEPFVRINHEHVQADLEAVVWPGLKPVRYPKELVVWNKRVHEAFATGVAAGTAAVPLDGKMIDVPVDEWAIVVLATAEACARRDAQKQAAMQVCEAGATMMMR